jgi:hypothetical protein
LQEDKTDFIAFNAGLVERHLLHKISSTNIHDPNYKDSNHHKSCVQTLTSRLQFWEDDNHGFHITTTSNGEQAALWHKWTKVPFAVLEDNEELMRIEHAHVTTSVPSGHHNVTDKPTLPKDGIPPFSKTNRTNKEEVAQELRAWIEDCVHVDGTSYPKVSSWDKKIAYELWGEGALKSKPMQGRYLDCLRAYVTLMVDPVSGVIHENPPKTNTFKTLSSTKGLHERCLQAYFFANPQLEIGLLHVVRHIVSKVKH